MSQPTKKRVARGTGRDALIQAAVGTVGKFGIEGATVRRIAEEAGVHNTLITHYFGSRESLLKEAAEWVIEQQLRIVDVSIDLALDEKARKKLVEEVDSSPLKQIFLYEMVLAPSRYPDLQESASKLYATYLERTQVSLKAQGFPDDLALARAVFASIDGLVLQQVSVATTAEILAALERLGDLLKGLRPQP
ncbi:TetR/AcrR family transcriptional regulator [Gulosibacter molinativorax]|uniref:TetR/AcrR family transcriptional regulator n=1 Tax=Gulosibacter molinativorax TaxID=256821 RepID=A0ABT7CAP4_9MICO|nr:TetR family transcriptional regulator [Gulosibacter molinativorax]MDJ1372264.1 TetR/AcrR family transcriptional regulator [Gulosibacter molinativorax]QUY63451.1 TetR family transcriptional regulator [Gulosibacter molinativorax]